MHLFFQTSLLVRSRVYGHHVFPHLHRHGHRLQLVVVPQAVALSSDPRQLALKFLVAGDLVVEHQTVLVHHRLQGRDDSQLLLTADPDALKAGRPSVRGLFGILGQEVPRKDRSEQLDHHAGAELVLDEDLADAVLPGVKREGL